jgi:hypothetical protein
MYEHDEMAAMTNLRFVAEMRMGSSPIARKYFF